MGYRPHHAGQPPFFVVTHDPPPSVRLNLDFTFVTDGVAPAIDAARAVCPSTMNVVVMGGANVIDQAVDQGLVERLRLHIAPVLLGSGTPLFALTTHRELRQVESVASSFATHITYSLR
jgi:dihydrofolate reductase